MYVSDIPAGEDLLRDQRVERQPSLSTAPMVAETFLLRPFPEILQQPNVALISGVIIIIYLVQLYGVKLYGVQNFIYNNLP